MKNAVVTVYNKASDVEKDDPEVLKIFMAPEFYFRGAEQRAMFLLNMFCV
jgi:hypothetical protein